MPLLHNYTNTLNLRYGIWHNTEGDDFFEKKLELFVEEKQEVSILKGRKKSEWLCSRYLLELVADHKLRSACIKDKYGKPYLKDGSEFISISHTFDYTGVIVSQYVCGIDIQVIVPKIIVIAPRFISVEEFKNIPENNNLPYIHVNWGAKEAMYKCYGKKELDFRKNIFVEPFTFDPEGFVFYGQIRKGTFIKKYSLYARQIENMILVYAIEI